MQSFTLTPKQQETLDFIKGFIAKRGESPTIVELRDGLKLRALRSAAERLESLEAKGFIHRNPRKHRNINLIDPLSQFSSFAGMSTIPVIASAGCDALQVYAQETYNEFLTIDEKLLGQAKGVVAIRAVGNSMVDAGIRNGDYALVEVTEYVKNGDRVVAILGDKAVIKNFYQKNNIVFLKPANEHGGYSPIVVRQEDARIFGKVLNVIGAIEKEDDMRFEYDGGY